MTILDYTEALVSRRPVVVRRKVSWGECDPAGVVYTPRFADYAASARDWYLRAALDVLDRPHPARQGVIYPMRAMAFDFSAFLAADDVFDMTVAATGLGRSAFTMRVEAVGLDGVRCFGVEMTSVCVDTGSRRSTALPAEVRARLEAELDG